jgi:hypothetical protein
MKKLRLLASFVLIVFMFTRVSSVAAQSYTFNLVREIVNVLEQRWDHGTRLRFYICQ